MPGIVTSAAEVREVTSDGFQLKLGDETLTVRFVDFPWFREATLAELRNVQRPTEGHLYWPLLDVDLGVASVRDPSAFPLVSRQTR